MPHGHAMLGDEAEAVFHAQGRFERLFRTLPPSPPTPPRTAGSLGHGCDATDQLRGRLLD